MFTSLRKVAMLLGAVAVLATGSMSYAVQLDGSLALSGIGVSQNGANLSVSTSISVLDTIVSSDGVGDYSPILATFPFTSFGPHTLDLADLVGSFSLTSAGIGSFTPTSAMILTQSANFLDIFFLGNFTPDAPGLLDTFAVSPTSLRISINQSGASLSEAITLNSPPVRIPGQVPEPGTWVLMITGSLGLLGYSWRRQRQA